jgi:hypothetical protein
VGSRALAPMLLVCEESLTPFRSPLRRERIVPQLIIENAAMSGGRALVHEG